MSIYQKRWSSVGSGVTPTITRSTPTATNVLSSGVEPSTVGTSWNSVRWNKPSTSYRASVASRFENNSTSPANSYTPRTSRFSSSAAKNAADVVSIGPSVSVRASRFDSTNMPNKEKYRSEARDLINKWSSRERNSQIANTYRSPVPRSTFRSSDSLTTQTTSTPSSTAVYNTAYRTSTSLTPTRPVVRYSAERTSILSPSPTPVLHTTPKADRPWRQRMAESSRIRSTLGDDYRFRQSSAESSIFSPSTRFTSSYVPYSARRSPTRDSMPQPIRETSRERDAEKQKKKSAKERTARRMSRQNSSQQNSSSDEDNMKRSTRSRSGSQCRPRRPKKKVETAEKLVVVVVQQNEVKSMQSSLYETGPEDSALIKSLSSQITESLNALAADSEGFQSCAASPLAPSISRSSSKNGVVKNQIIKSPSLVQVLGLPKSESKSSMKLEEREEHEESHDEPLTNDDYFEPSETSRIDDESQYSAVAHFKPNKVKRLAPVPGLWKSGAENEEFISRNKRFAKENAVETAELMRKEANFEKANLRIKMAKVDGKPGKPVAKPVTKPVAKPAENPVDKPADKPVAKAAVTPVPKPATKPVEKPVAKPAEIPVVKPVSAESTTGKPVAKAVDKPVATPLAKPVDKPVSKPAEIPVAKPVATPVAKPVDKPVSKQAETPVPKPVADPVVKPVTKPAEIPVAKPVENSLAKPVAKPVTKTAETPVAKPVAEPAAKPIAKPAEIPVAKPATLVAKPVEKPVPKPVAEPVVTPVAKPVEIPVAKPVATPMAKPADNPVTTPVAKPAETPLVKPVDKPVAKPAEIPVAKPVTTPVGKTAEKPVAKPVAKPVEKPVATAIVKPILKPAEKPVENLAATKAEKPEEPVPKPSDPAETPKKVVPKKKKKPAALEEVEVTKVFSKKAWGAQRTEKVIRMRNQVKTDGYRCTACGNVSTDLTESYRRRAQAERATVLVDTPVVDVNHSTVELSLREKRKKKKRITPPPPPVAPVMEPETSSRPVSVASRASVILDEMRGTEAAVEWTRDLDDDDYNGILELPDKSILEQYIARKRGRLDRYRGLRPSSMCSYASSTCPSPCPSTVSELCLPSSVLVHEPRRRAMNSAEPTDVCSTTPVPLNSTPRGFSTKPVAPAVMKPVPFEAPKTLFEKMIQDQANRNRTTIETRDSSSRRGSQEEGMSSISQQFAAAAAAGNSAHGSVRYAAHIPVRSGESSGRMSTASVDSQQSGGTLDAASKNIDQVIDQARHRHHQHRTKFKEAIDYLDQIFEDLKKECDVPDDKNNNKKSEIIAAPTKKSFVAVKKKKTSPSSPPSAPDSSKQKPSEENTAKLIDKAPSPVEVVIPVRKVSQTSNHATEPTVAETIVLAKRTDKMDFTRRWLQDDLQSLAYLPPANIAPNASYYQDFDEHSLGSCSAEVAAFNTTKEKRATRKASDASDMIRPRPFRPQPVYPTRIDDLVDMKRSGSSSHDAYNTLRSMRSEGDGSDCSAFRQVSPFMRGSLRSSLRSLHKEPKDAVMSIDQLVAELELNTENTLSVSDKRRSFPTTFVGRQPQQQKPVHHAPSEYEKPNRYRAEMRHAPTRGRVQNFASTKAPPQQQQQQQQRLDEVTNMLNRVVSQFGADHRLPTKPTGNAFETINQERINPSRVEAMHNMFERGTAPTSWKMMQQQQQQSQPIEERNNQKMSPLQEATYATLNRFSPPPPPRNPSYHEFTPQLPTSQPPQRPPGSANSSQGGYYSSNSSQHHTTNARRSQLIDQQSISSRMPSVENDDDDGFYDNIGIYDDRRYSRASEPQLPPTTTSGPKTNRIGSFLRKIGGGGSNRPPGSAASLMSLNKIANETTVFKPTCGLMKSNSLSNEPWKRQVLDASMPREANNNHKTGLGARLKNSIFGSRKRLDG